MLDVLGWLIFLAALMVSVMLHETGHFVTAKRFGMKCTQYFVGFGPTIWSTQRGETEYGVKALPLGGFVKITGMTSIDEVDEEDELALVSPARRELAAADRARGGVSSFMHFVLAAVIIFGLALGIGIENDVTTNRVASVTPCVQLLERRPCSNGAAVHRAGCRKSSAARPRPGWKVGDTARPAVQRGLDDQSAGRG